MSKASSCKASSCTFLAIALTAFLISCSEAVSPKAIAPEPPEPPEPPAEKVLMGRTLAGDGTAGLVNGPGDTARFNGPVGVGVDSSGNVYVGDYSNHRLRKITADGTVSSLAGDVAGIVDGTGGSARLKNPQGVAVDSSDIIYVINDHCIRKITANGAVSTLAGTTAGGFTNGTGSGAHFRFPVGVGVDSRNGNVYVGDKDNQRIRKVTAGGTASTFAGSVATGFVNGVGSSARFNNPRGMAVDSSGNIYVADSSNHSIRKITPDGTVSTLAGNGTAGFADGAGSSARFRNPVEVAVDSSGNVYVADRSNHRIRKITSEGVVSTLAGDGTAGFKDGAPDMMQFNSPVGVAVDSSGNIYVADYGNNRIRKIEYITP